MTTIKPFYRIWQLSLLSFIIAAFTGVLYRFGMIFPLADWSNFANIRHAHSHLMFFNWVSPPVMAWMVSYLSPGIHSDYIPKFKYCLYLMLFLGFLSYPFFLLYGYGSVQVFSAELPLAAIISGMVMITWYLFTWIYYHSQKDFEKTETKVLFDASLLALVVSSLGAWGVSVVQFSGMDNPLFSSALTHFFLSVFTEGWAIPAIFALIWTQAPPSRLPIHHGWLWLPMLFGSMLVFPFSLNQSVISSAMLFSAKTGVVLILISTILNFWFLVRQKHLCGMLWNTIFILIFFKIIFQLIVLFPFDIWPAEHGLRVLYLHTLLLGIFSVTLVTLYQKENRVITTLFAVSVILVLLSLGIISGYWPAPFMPPNVHTVVAGISILPLIALLWILLLSQHITLPAKG